MHSSSTACCNNNGALSRAHESPDHVNSCDVTLSAPCDTYSPRKCDLKGTISGPSLSNRDQSHFSPATSSLAQAAELLKTLRK